MYKRERRREWDREREREREREGGRGRGREREKEKEREGGRSSGQLNCSITHFKNGMRTELAVDICISPSENASKASWNSVKDEE